ncbi:Ctr copper transporter family protein [Durotheca rogersii]|uniref:Ctr copper transporter family protein n=1 Tax=Durotheca rogersii TaxID=419775 RepID=UPI00221E7EA4|nr:Ctr copper transporter family protein [Durotheca rogersii]KAI5861808.1 Ctr copper transporter family protein [Durotheca rogersii]
MDHSHMDHSHMATAGMDHGNMGRGDMCKMSMLFTWDTTNLCIVFRQWHIRGPVSLVLSLLAVVAIGAGYEALRELIRRYDASAAASLDAVAPNEPSTESTTLLPAGRNGPADRRTRVVKSVLYAIQNFYAFMIMLLFMTYNGSVMLAVAVGAGLGYYFFGSHTKAAKETACH